jgi:uncharacterized membrane protein YeaQ/YmgE (transglycosylase-associated protein family)
MVGALVLGIVAGAIARLVIPNDAFEHLEGWRSWLASLLLGLVGAFLGWGVFRAVGIGDENVFDLVGVIGAILGSVVVLLVAGWVMHRSGRGRTHGTL